MLNVRPLLLSLFIIVFGVSCTSRRVYSGVENVPSQGWEADSVLSFDIHVEESQLRTECIVFVRHTTDYNYQNFWLFLDLISPEGIVSSDTVECYLADQRGRWLGNGWGALREMPILWKETLPLEQGLYTLKVRQGMRTEKLKGISSIGVEIKTNK